MGLDTTKEAVFMDEPQWVSHSPGFSHEQAEHDSPNGV